MQFTWANQLEVSYLHVLELGKKCLLSYHMLIILSPHIICSNSCTSTAIVAGSNISTATWKGWDDPAVVPGKESDDWLDYNGFGFSGMNSYFPHMSSEWKRKC